MPGDTPPICERCLKPARDEIHGPVETCRENGRGGCNEPKAHHAFRPARTAPAPLAFDAAIAALDVEPTHHPDRMVTTYDILGLDAVRAAHRAEVERAVREAVEQEREACAKEAESHRDNAWPFDAAPSARNFWCDAIAKSIRAMPLPARSETGGCDAR